MLIQYIIIKSLKVFQNIIIKNKNINIFNYINFFSKNNIFLIKACINT